MNNNYTALDHVTTSRPTPNPPITVLLALTPQPATLADQAAFEEFAARFSADFSNFCIEEMWSCISLYSHYREWAQRNQEFNERHRGDQDDATPPSMGPNGSGSGTTTSITTTAATTSLSRYAIAEAEIGTIHPFALRTRLEQETEVHWEFFLPVLQRLIEREVAQGMRLFVIGGLKLGDVEGVRAFARKVSFSSRVLDHTDSTDGILFLSTDRRTSRHPSFSSVGRRLLQICHRTWRIREQVRDCECRMTYVFVVPTCIAANLPIVFSDHQIASPPHPSQAYNMVLAALYAKCFPRVSRRVTVLDLTGDSSSSDEDESGVQEFDGEDRVMSGS